MIKKTVPLDPIEKKLIQIAYQSNEKELNKKFDWKAFTFALIVGVLSLFVLLFCNGFGIHWLFFVIAFIAFVVLYNIITEYPEGRNIAIFRQERLSKLLHLEEVEIYECCCGKALHLFDDLHEGSFYIFEVAEDKCVAFSDPYHEMSSLLPNTKFSFFVDQSLYEVLGEHLKVYGERFVPYKYNDGEPFWGERSFPAHLEIINCSLEGYLEEVLSE